VVVGVSRTDQTSCFGRAGPATTTLDGPWTSRGFLAGVVGRTFHLLVTAEHERPYKWRQGVAFLDLHKHLNRRP